MGKTGNFGGEDIIDIICKQESTARFIARHMYNFFVADEPPVPSWPHIEPKDPDAIQQLVDAYFTSGYSIKEMLRTLLKSDFFKAEKVRYKRVKSPTELVAGVLRLSGHIDRPRREMLEHAQRLAFMGQMLHDPPSVEGWHQGEEWIQTGSLVERVNFASEQLGDRSMPGVSAMVSNVENTSSSSDDLLEACLKEMGEIEISDATQDNLRKYSVEPVALDDDRTIEMLRLIAASPDFQLC